MSLDDKNDEVPSPDVVGAIGAVPLPTITDALRAIAETLAADPTEEGQHSAMLLTQAAARIEQLERELCSTTYRAEHAEACLSVPSASEPLEGNEWITQARLTLDRLAAFLQKFPDECHRVNWRDWIAECEKRIPSSFKESHLATDATDLIYVHRRTRDETIEECARLCEEASNGSTRKESDRSRNSACLSLAGMIRDLKNAAPQAPVGPCPSSPARSGSSDSTNGERESADSVSRQPCEKDSAGMPVGAAPIVPSSERLIPLDAARKVLCQYCEEEVPFTAQSKLGSFKFHSVGGYEFSCKAARLTELAASAKQP